jgi:hypothetical protein
MTFQFLLFLVSVFLFLFFWVFLYFFSLAGVFPLLIKIYHIDYINFDKYSWEKVNFLTPIIQEIS